MSKIYRKDVDSLSQKLEVFAKDLPDQERRVLGWLMDRAQSTELSDSQLDNVAGGALSDSLGFGPSDDSVSVGWSKSFNQA